MKLWWVRLLSYALVRWRGLMLVLLLMLINVGLNVLKPWPLKLIVDRILSNSTQPNTVFWLSLLPGDTPSQLLAWLAAATIALFLASESVNLLQSYVSSGVSSQMGYDLGAALFDRLQRLSLSFHNQQQSGDLVRRIVTDSNCIQNLLSRDALISSERSPRTLSCLSWNFGHLDLHRLYSSCFRRTRSLSQLSSSLARSCSPC